MDPELVSLVDPAGGLYIHIDDAGNINSDLLTPWNGFEISKPDDRFAIKYNGKYLGADGTQFSPNGICKQLQLVNDRGNYESWFIGVRPSGLIEATIEYIEQGVRTVPFCSIALTVRRNV